MVRPQNGEANIYTLYHTNNIWLIPCLSSYPLSLEYRDGVVQDVNPTPLWTHGL